LIDTVRKVITELGSRVEVNDQRMTAIPEIWRLRRP